MGLCWNEFDVGHMYNVQLPASLAYQQVLVLLSQEQDMGHTWVLGHYCSKSTNVKRTGYKYNKYTLTVQRPTYKFNSTQCQLPKPDQYFLFSVSTQQYYWVMGVVLNSISLVLVHGGSTQQYLQSTRIINYSPIAFALGVPISLRSVTIAPRFGFPV